MSEDPEQSHQVEASPALPRAHTPLLSRFLGAAPSPAISLKNFGKTARGHPHLLRRWGDSSPSPRTARGDDPEAVARIEEEETEDEGSQTNASPAPCARAPNRLQPPEIRVELVPDNSSSPDSSAA